MDFLFDAMGTLLAIFYRIIPNYSATIILLTLAVMVVLTPLTLKGTRSMMMMQQLQPEMRKIQNQYKDNRQKLNEELLKFYKENNINPMGGCLPLIAQMPVFLVLYTVLRGLTRRESDMGYLVGWATGQGGSGSAPSEAPDLLLNFDPAYVEPSSELYQSLSQVNVMAGPLGVDLSESASRALSVSLVHALPYFVLIAIVGVTGFVQQKQIQGRVPKNQVNPQQQMLMKIMPIMLPVFSFGLPAGLVLYFCVSNLYRIGQQWFISRSIYGIKRGETIDDKRRSDKTPAGVVTGKVTGESSREVGAKSTKAVSDGKNKPTPKRSSGAQANKAKAKTKAKKGSSGRTTASKSSKSSSGKGRGTSGTSSSKDRSGSDAPVLQPRARKKKR